MQPILMGTRFLAIGTKSFSLPNSRISPPVLFTHYSSNTASSKLRANTVSQDTRSTRASWAADGIEADGQGQLQKLKWLYKTAHPVPSLYLASYPFIHLAQLKVKVLTIVLHTTQSFQSSRFNPHSKHEVLHHPCFDWRCPRLCPPTKPMGESKMPSS